MPLLSRLAQRRRRKLEEFLESNLEPGETLQATVPMTRTNNRAFLGVPFAKFSGVGLTSERLYFVKWAEAVPERPESVLGRISREAVKIATWKRVLPLTQGTLILSGDDDSIRLKVPGMHRDEAERFVEQLSHDRAE